MYENENICDIIFVNGYFYKIKKINNMSLLPTKYFSQDVSIALARWIAARSLCFVRQELMKISEKEYTKLSNQWPYAAPFDKYWIKYPNNSETEKTWEDIKANSDKYFSLQLPRNAWYKFDGQILLYNIPYYANAVTARKHSAYRCNTIIDSPSLQCVIQTEIPQGHYYLLPCNNKFTVKEASTLADMISNKAMNEIIQYISVDLFQNVYYNEDDGSLLFI